MTEVYKQLKDIYKLGDINMNTLDSTYPIPMILIPIKGFHPRFKDLESGFIHLCKNQYFNNPDNWNKQSMFFIPTKNGGVRFHTINETVKWLKYLVTG